MPAASGDHAALREHWGHPGASWWTPVPEPFHGVGVVTPPEWADPLVLALGGSVLSIVVGCSLLLATAARRHEPIPSRFPRRGQRGSGTRPRRRRRLSAAPVALGAEIVGGWGPRGAVAVATGDRPGPERRHWLVEHDGPLVDAPVLHTPPPYSSHPVDLAAPVDTGAPVDVRHPGTFVVVPVRAAASGGSPLHGPVGGRPGLPALSEDLVPRTDAPFPTGHGSGPPPVPAPSRTD